MNKPLSFILLLKKMPKMKKRLLRTGGRNHSGRITVYHRGGGVKVCYRFIDFWRNFEIPAVVLRIEKDPLRTGFLALILYMNGVVSYILAADLLDVGDIIFSGTDWVAETAGLMTEKITSVVGLPYGSCLPLGLCPLGLEVSNIELRPGFGGQICRAAGAKALVVKKTLGFVVVKLKSGWNLVLSKHCKVMLGTISNATHMFDIKRKAGFNRNKGFRPTVRGVAMNPVDHPHGGGEGKSSGGKKPMTPWGQITKGRSTVAKSKRVRELFFKYKEAKI